MLKRQELDQQRQKSVAELQKEVAGLEQQIVDNRTKIAQGSINNVRAQRQLRKQVAQLKSLIAVKDES